MTRNAPLVPATHSPTASRPRRLASPPPAAGPPGAVQGAYGFGPRPDPGRHRGHLDGFILSARATYGSLYTNMSYHCSIDDVRVTRKVTTVSVE